MIIEAVNAYNIFIKIGKQGQFYQFEIHVKSQCNEALRSKMSVGKGTKFLSKKEVNIAEKYMRVWGAIVVSYKSLHSACVRLCRAIS